MARQEDFPISSEILEQFISENRKQWKGNHPDNKWVIVNFSMVRMQVAWIVPKLIYAKGMADETGARVAVFTWRANDRLTSLIESFGFVHIVIDDYIHAHISVLLKAAFKTMQVLATKKTGEKLKDWMMNGYSIGLSFYEDILRTSSMSTIRTTRNKIVVKKLMHLLAFYYAIMQFVRDKNIVSVVVDDLAYHEGMLTKIFSANKNCVVVKMNHIEKRKVSMMDDKYIETTGPYLRKFVESHINSLDTEEVSEWTDRYLAERFQGKNGREIDRGAFADKIVLNRTQLCQELGLDETKKNVVIMAHTFTDAVFNYGAYYFRDYYDWLEKTLQYASKVTTVNWILKPHPTRHAYNESTDSIEAMFDRICGNKENMFLLNDNISGQTIANIADIQITIGGNSGAEYACFGVPAIIIGKPYYSGFGYTIEPKTLAEYIKIINEINQIPPLTAEQVDTAKKVFYLRNSKAMDAYYYKFKDQFANVINAGYSKMLEKMAIQYFESNRGTTEYNNMILSEMVEFMKSNDLSRSDYYQSGMRDMRF